MTFAKGIYSGVSAIEYHADPAQEASLSNSLIPTLLNKSPRHAWLAHPRLNPLYRRTDSAVFDLGRAAHSLLLEGIDNCAVIVADDWRTKAAKEERDAARESGKVPLLSHQHEQVICMVDAAKSFVSRSQLAGLFERGKGEQMMIWQMGGIWCRSLMDWPLDDRTLVVDYKTTAASCPEAWMRGHMEQHGYDTQAEFTLRGLTHLGHHGAKFKFLVQETEPPYMCYFVDPDESMLAVAASKVTRAVTLWEQCVTQKKWPGYLESYSASASAWSIAQEEGKL
jgi:hypothetical protein